MFHMRFGVPDNLEVRWVKVGVFEELRYEVRRSWLVDSNRSPILFWINSRYCILC